MKPPKYRVSDVLYMDKSALREVIDFVRGGLPLMDFSVDPRIGKAPYKLCMYGSYTFGNARLRSDMDFGLQFQSEDIQKYARRLFHTPVFRSEFAKYIDRYKLDTGLGIDMGCTDAKPHEYNIHLDCETMLLHYRYEPDLDYYRVNSVPELIERKETRDPIDVMAFDPEKDEPPPVHKIHLKYDGYAGCFLPIKDLTNPIKHLSSSWDKDPYASEVDDWESLYGKRYTGYTEVDGKLVGDRHS